MPSEVQDPSLVGQLDTNMTPSPLERPTIRLPPECIELIVQYLWDDMSALPSQWDSERDSQQETDASEAGSIVVSAAKAAIRPVYVPSRNTRKLAPIPDSPTVDYLFYYTHQTLIPKGSRSFQTLNPDAPKHHLPGFKVAYVKAMTNIMLSFSGHYPSRIQVLSVSPLQMGYFLYKLNMNLNMEKANDDGAPYWLERGHGIEALRLLRRLEVDFGMDNIQYPRPGSTAQSTVLGIDADTGRELNVLDLPLMFIQEHQRLFSQSEDDDVSANQGGEGASSSSTRNREGTPMLQEIAFRGNAGDSSEDGTNVWSPARLLAQIQPVKVVDISAWNSKVPDIETIPTARLQSLRINIERRRGHEVIHTPFLRRCEKLQDIRMHSVVPDTFRWAIDLQQPIGADATEARQRRRVHLPTISTTAEAGDGDAEEWNASDQENEPAPPTQEQNVQQLLQQLQQFQLQIQQQNQHLAQALSPDAPLTFDPTHIPKLRKVALYGGPKELVPSLEDATDAFRDTLEELCGFEDGYGRKSEYLSMRIDWPMPHLTTLHMRGRFVFFFMLRSLAHCPNLRVVKLIIESDISVASMANGVQYDYYNPQDLAVLTELKYLEVLQLGGMSWDIDDRALDMLAGIQGQEQGQEQDNHGSSLPNSLVHFNIAESYLATTAGLNRFLQAMGKLRLIELGTKYEYFKRRMPQEIEDRVYIDINGSD
ncbi:hypothetical protein BGX31_007736 [Mortierella sp. GBA43]|nr:hypothetical protein BGX31_007736 [Mortierella sp. GBA43]